jgi:hypothetical protein
MLNLDYTPNAPVGPPSLPFDSINGDISSVLIDHAVVSETNLGKQSDSSLLKLTPAGYVLSNYVDYALGEELASLCEDHRPVVIVSSFVNANGHVYPSPTGEVA